MKKPRILSPSKSRKQMLREIKERIENRSFQIKSYNKVFICECGNRIEKGAPTFITTNHTTHKGVIPASELFC